MHDSHAAPTLDTAPDTELVTASLDGDREAFGLIVSRYQGLLCALAYSATGSASESEDLAQEAFVEAWQQLRTLREPEKLRAWLCAILRHKVGRSRRSGQREPVRLAEGLEAAEDLPSLDPPAEDSAMANEEQAILWRALARVPALYREPLVLYYREHRSVEHVAVALDLTEDAVKQRLARGRKILQERVLSLVENALSRSGPGRGFTLGVLAALPQGLVSAKIAATAAAAAQGGAVAKSTGLAALIGGCSGVLSAALSLRANLDQARTPRERRTTVRITLGFFVGALLHLALLYLLRSVAIDWEGNRFALAWTSQIWTLAFVAAFPFALLRVMRHMRALRSEERRRHPELFRAPRDQVGSSAGEYRSRLTLLGVPFVHLRFSTPDAGQGPVVGWIAGGDRAYGLLFAWGGLAVAPISVGAVAVGLLALGSVGFGLISVGTAAVGLVAIGCMAIGVNAAAWLSALGWQTAQGSGFALALLAAQGPIAMAPHANDDVARRMLADPHPAQTQAAFLIALSLLTIVPTFLYAREVRRRLGRPTKSVPDHPDPVK